MQHDVYTSKLFRKSFNRLDLRVQNVVDLTIQNIRMNYLETVSEVFQQFSVTGRKIIRTRCRGTQYRLVWEWLESGDIGIWQVGTHTEIDNFKPENLPSAVNAQWILVETTAHKGVTPEEISVAVPLAKPPEFDGAGILDHLIELSTVQKDLIHANATGPLLIRGVAGSGKTSLGLHRAEYISKLRARSGRDTTTLILTFSNALKTALGWMYADKFGELPESLTIESFGDWMLKCLREANIDFSAMDSYSRKDAIRQVRSNVAKSLPFDNPIARFSSSFLLSEIDDVIRGREVKSLTEYKCLKRSGRRRALGQSQRVFVWEVYRRYEVALREQNKFDWAELPELVTKHCRPLSQYDVVIVDEAQDIRPNYLNLATQLISDYSDSRSLTLLGDLAQSIHYSGVSWRDARLPLRGGRTRLLTQNHRNTRQIMVVALPILEKCRSLGNVRRHHSPASIERPGDKPMLIRYTSPHHAADYIANEINGLRHSLRLEYNNFAILSPRTLSKSEMFRALKKNLPDRGIGCRHFRHEDFLLDDKVGLITMHSAKGLEFPVVFIIDFEEGTIPYVGRSSASPQEIEERARKLAYVSMTRATQRLYILYPKSNPSRFVHDIINANANAVDILDLQ